MELEGPSISWSSISTSGNSLSFPLNDVIICPGSMFCPVLQFLSDWGYGCQTHLWTPAFVLARQTCILYLDFKKYNIQYPFLMIPKMHHLVMNIESVCLWVPAPCFTIALHLSMQFSREMSHFRTRLAVWRETGHPNSTKPLTCTNSHADSHCERLCACKARSHFSPQTPFRPMCYKSADK